VQQNKLGKEAKNIFKILLKDKPLTKGFIAIKFASNGGRKEIGASALVPRPFPDGEISSTGAEISFLPPIEAL